MSRFSVLHRLAYGLGGSMLCTLTPVALRAQQPRQRFTPPPTLEVVVAYALAHNPDARIAQLRSDSTRAEQRVARSFQNPVLSATPGLPSQYGVSVPLDLGPSRTLRTHAAAQATHAAAFDSADVTRQLMYSVRQAFFDLLLADSLRRVAIDQRHIFAQLLVADSARLRTGSIPERDVTRSELELARADAAVLRADANDRSARLALQLVMGIPDLDTGFCVTGTLQFKPVDIHMDTTDTTLANTIRYRTDVGAAETRLGQSLTLQSLATAQCFPTPTVNVVRQPEQPFVSGSHYALGVGVQIPVWNWYGGERARARAGLHVAEQNYRRATLQARADIMTAYDTFQAAQLLAKRYTEGLLAKASQDLEAAQYAYRSGSASLVDLLSAVTDYSTIRTEYLTSIHDYWVSAYALNRAVGREVISP